VVALDGFEVHPLLYNVICRHYNIIKVYTGFFSNNDKTNPTPDPPMVGNVGNILYEQNSVSTRYDYISVYCDFLPKRKSQGDRTQIYPGSGHSCGGVSTESSSPQTPGLQNGSICGHDYPRHLLLCIASPSPSETKS
jgi:hypothetical protein